MITPSNVSWGSYRQYEGAYFGGSKGFVLSANPTEGQRIMAVVTSTEGGKADAINAYDRCIISCGYIQWCEAMYLVSNLLGYIFTQNPGLMAPMKPALDASGAVFKRKDQNKWRFYFGNGGGQEVDDHAEQTKLFLLNSTGLKGSWDDASKTHVKLWAASLANTLAQPEADTLQVEYTAARIRTFATREAATLLFDGQPDAGWVGGLRAGFLSFAANLPAVASKHLLVAAGASSAPKWSEDWCIGILKQLTFGPGISIYPGRYNKIRPVIEKLYGINLPDFAEELKVWQAHQNEGMDAPSASEPTFQNVEEVQELLIHLGYDLGPAGADGKSGPKTRDAIQAYQTARGLDPDGVVGKMTRKDMLTVYRALPLR